MFHVFVTYLGILLVVLKTCIRKDLSRKFPWNNLQVWNLYSNIINHNHFSELMPVKLSVISRLYVDTANSWFKELFDIFCCSLPQCKICPPSRISRKENTFLYSLSFYSKRNSENFQPIKLYPKNVHQSVLQVLTLVA